MRTPIAAALVAFAVVTGATAPSVAAEPRTTWRLCPVWAFKATIGLIADGMPGELAWSRWCYEIAMPHRQNPKHATDEPEWVIPYDSTVWIATKFRDGQVLRFEEREIPAN